MKTLRYITRIDSGSTHCWWVRVQQQQKINYIQKSFPDSRYGGKRKARQAAVEFRDKTLATMPKIKHMPLNGRRRYGKGYYLRSKIGRNGWPYFYWIAHYWDTKQKKQLRKWFSVNKYGYERARELAKQHRKFMVTGEL